MNVLLAEEVLNVDVLVIVVLHQLAKAVRNADDLHQLVVKSESLVPKLLHREKFTFAT